MVSIDFVCQLSIIWMFESFNVTFFPAVKEKQMLLLKIITTKNLTANSSFYNSIFRKVSLSKKSSQYVFEINKSLIINFHFPEMFSKSKLKFRAAFYNYKRKKKHETYRFSWCRSADAICDEHMLLVLHIT